MHAEPGAGAGSRAEAGVGVAATAPTRAMMAREKRMLSVGGVGGRVGLRSAVDIKVDGDVGVKVGGCCILYILQQQ